MAFVINMCQNWYVINLPTNHLLIKHMVPPNHNKFQEVKFCCVSRNRELEIFGNHIQTFCCGIFSSFSFVKKNRLCYSIGWELNFPSLSHCHLQSPLWGLSSNIFPGHTCSGYWRIYLSWCQRNFLSFLIPVEYWVIKDHFKTQIVKNSQTFHLLSFMIGSCFPVVVVLICWTILSSIQLIVNVFLRMFRLCYIPLKSINFVCFSGQLTWMDSHCKLCFLRRSSTLAVVLGICIMQGVSQRCGQRIYTRVYFLAGSLLNQIPSHFQWL